MRILMILAIAAVAAGQTIPTQFAGLSNSTAPLQPMLLPPRPSVGGTYSDIYHPDGAGYVGIQRLTRPSTCTIRAWVSNLYVYPEMAVAYNGHYYAIPWSVGHMAAGAFSLTTTAATAAGGTVLTFASTAAGSNYFNGLVPGVEYTAISGTGVTPNTTVVSFDGTTVTLASPAIGTGVAAGTAITFGTLPTQAPYVEVTQAQACTDAVHTAPSYSQIQAWNADESRFMIFDRMISGASFYRNTSPPTYEKTIINSALASGNGSEVWDKTDPDVIFFFDRFTTKSLRKLDVATGAESLVYQFTIGPGGEDCPTGTAYIENGGGGQPSADQRYWAGWCIATSGNATRVWVYDKVLNQVVTKRDTANICGGSPPSIDWMGVSPSGSYIDIAWRVTTYGDSWHTCQGNELFDRATLTSLGMVMSKAAHNDFGYDAQGHEIIAAGHFGHQHTPGALVYSYSVFFKRLDQVHAPPYDETYVKRLQLPCTITYNQVGADPYACATPSIAGPTYHISGRGSMASTSRGWWLYSTFMESTSTEGTGWGKAENVALLFDDSQAQGDHIVFRRLSRTLTQRLNQNTARCSTGWDYWQESHSTPNRAFTKFIFGSNWLSQCGLVQTYMVDLGATPVPNPPSGISATIRGGAALRGGALIR